MAELPGYQHQIDAVREKIIEQKVPTKYPKGMAILCTLYCNYEAGDALAGVFLERLMANDPTFLGDLEREAGIKTSGGFRDISGIMNYYSKDYQVFRALKIAGVNGDIEDSLKEVK